MRVCDRFLGGLVVFFSVAMPCLGAELVPSWALSGLVVSDVHWLDSRYQKVWQQGRLVPSCREFLAGASTWLQRGAFERPESGLGQFFRTPEGITVINKNTYESHISVPPSVLAKMGGKLFEAYRRVPVRSLYLDVQEGEDEYQRWATLFARSNLQQGFAGVSVLSVPAAALPALAKSPNFPNVDTLVIAPRHAEDLSALLASTNLPKLRRLEILATQLSAQSLGQLLANPGFARITELSFRLMNFGDEGLAVLAESAALEGLSALSLEIDSALACSNLVTESGLRRLFQSKYLGNLSKLSLKSLWRLGPGAVNVLLEWQGLTQIEHLELFDTQADHAVAQLLEQSRFPRLAELRLEGTVYDDRLLDALTHNESLVSLRRALVQLHPDVSQDAVMAFSQASHLSDTTLVYEIRN